MNVDSKTYISTLERSGREQYRMYKKYRVTVPVGKSGPWCVRHFETEMGLSYLRHARDGRPCGIGKFTALSHDQRGMVMSDTCPEVDDLRRTCLYRLRGDVLISGLGLGMVAHMLTRLPELSEHVNSITIIEKDADVIKLCADHYRKDKRIEIIHADTFAWVPPKGAHYDAAWHDIWDEMCGDYRPEMTTLRRRYQRHVAKGQQYCWGEAFLDRERRSAWG